MPFNKAQTQAIMAPSNIDILIAAGAGSGKTKVLSERVYRLIEEGEVRPDQLLVLTFTNNAAHEMKNRILARFGVDHPRYAKMLSCHVQSFDSFLGYLVRTNADALGVSPDIAILPDYLMKQKRSAFLDEALQEAYADPKRRAVLAGFIRKNTWKTDEKIKESVLYLLRCLSRFTPQERDAYIQGYAERFLSPCQAQSLYHEVCESYRDELRLLLRRAVALDRLARFIVVEKGEGTDYEGLAHYLDDASIFASDLRDCSISPDTDKSGDEDFLDREFHDLLDLLDLDDEAFVLAAGEMVENHREDYFRDKYPGSQKKAISSSHYHRLAFMELKKAKGVLSLAAELGGVEEERRKLLDNYEGIKELFALAGAVQDKMADYRKQHSAYSFEDVTALALRLFLEQDENPRFASIVEGLRRRFRYIMVDEYQDTNDFQEILIDGLSAPCSDGSRSHVFCVGDAKQSIYAFRNSKVELFRKREAAYASSGKDLVIPMCTNYRSSKRILADINYLFLRYMRPDQGGIDYGDPNERLNYDDAVNLYHKDTGSYGIHRVLPPVSMALGGIDLSLQPFQKEEYEAKAILADIKEKLASGFLVFDREIHDVRPCKRSDFCVLLRKKREIGLYQEIFTRDGMPINNELNVNLREINAVCLVQTLLGIVSYFLGDDNAELEHLFASLARSYCASYSDDMLHHILSDDMDKGREAVAKRIESEPIMVALKEFAFAYKDQPFEVTYCALLDRFKVIENLYLIGDVDDNIAKIESMYALVRVGVSLGEGIKEFLAELQELDQRRLEVSAETVFQSADAVDLMTIHGSKGLERKIVYMPMSQNGISRGDNRLAPPFDFSSRYGLLFPYFALPFPDLEDMKDSSPFLTLSQKAYDSSLGDEEKQEHVRLLYVALTRAENAIYLVGKPEHGEKNGYLMMEDVPCFIRINERLLDYVSPSNLTRYQELCRLCCPAPGPLGDEIAQKACRSLYRQYVKDGLQAQKKEAAYEIVKEIYAHYLSLLRAKDLSLDEWAKIYAYARLPRIAAKLGGLGDLVSLASDVPGLGNIEQAKETLERFQKAVLEDDPSLLTKAKDDTLADAMVYPLARFFDGVDYVYYESYEAEGYPDETSFYDESTFDGKEGVVLPPFSPLRIDDAALDFPPIVHRRASKKMEEDEEVEKRDLLSRGSALHRYLEMLDFDAPDLSYVTDPKDRKLLERVLSLPLMQEALSASERYPEYGFYDEINLTRAYIDLLYVKDGVYHIVDYKTSDIEKKGYVDQLRQYGENVCRLFGVPSSQVRLHLLSLYQGVSKDVPYQD